MTVKTIEKSIQNLKPAEQLRIADAIFQNLHGSNPAVERAWGIESDRRLAAYKKGGIKTVSYDDIKKRLLQ
ncbi:MAG: addiction module protein [Candidatus Omnitrophica bacterium]|nr:addiction module protein [Candidatus Omnitrophota bacterium]